MKFPILNIDGTKGSTLEISDKLINLKVNHKLIKFVIDWQLNHSKPRTAKTKQRNQIAGSTKKIVAQKGSGGARHASKKAPLFVGGGVAHGRGRRTGGRLVGSLEDGIEVYLGNVTQPEPAFGRSDEHRAARRCSTRHIMPFQKPAT